MRLLRKMLTCGRIDFHTKNINISNIGTPQGNVASPVMANIVLDKLDKYMAKYKKDFEKGKSRRLTKEYISLRNRRNYTLDAEEKHRL